MIIYTNSDLFESPAKVLVNTVNTRGVMGKGIALRFKKIYPEMFSRYREHCEHRRLTIGKLYLYKTTHKWILNFPTKEHWRYPSRVEYIEAGLRKFEASCAEIGAPSIAFPMLGCGNGELDFEAQVKPLMEKYLGALSIPALIHIGRNHVGPPEHRDAKNNEEWLRSEPAALPFDEVWQDLVHLLAHQNKFRTRRKQTEFTVRVKECPPELVVVTSGRTSARIGTRELIEFWQQLRDHGLTHKGIAPNHRHLSYLMPIFEQLDYVRPISVSESASRLSSNPSAALQVIPPPILGDQQKWSLFGSNGIAAQA